MRLRLERSQESNLTSSAVLTTQKVADTISLGEAGVLMHGPTFMGNPLACAIGLESIRMLNEQPMKEIVANIERILKEELAPAAALPGVTDVRVLGSIGVVEVNKTVDVGRFQKVCIERGVWIRPFGHNVYLMPPYIIGEDDLRKLCRELIEIVSDESNY